MLEDKKFRIPRIWSNKELSRFSGLFSGSIVNVSGWKDEDKEGSEYKKYFNKKDDYWITNYKAEARGFQGTHENEIFLDLEEDLDQKLVNKFDVIFNHTVLEHIFDINKAFENLCKLSNDVVIIVVPFLQEQHADYGDYWRFTPLAVKKLFEKNNMELIYINYNDDKVNSIYIFAIATKRKKDYTQLIKNDHNNKLKNISTFMLGTKVIRNGFFITVFMYLKKVLKYIKSSN